MIEAAILLAAVGAADLVRALVARRVPSIVLGALVGTAVAVLGAVFAGAATWAAVVVVVLLALWLWAMTPEPGDEPERIWPAAVRWPTHRIRRSSTGTPRRLPARAASPGRPRS